jgi:transcriptional regulator with GAF, ATPase, and Fis domain
MKKPEHNYFRDLYEIAIAVNSAGTVEAVLRSIVENTAKALNAKGGSIMMLSPDRKTLTHTISYGLSDAFIKMGPRQVTRSLPETVTGRGGVSIVRDLNEESGRVAYPDAAKKEGIVSILAVPMKLKDNIVGELRVYTAEKRDFSGDDIFFVQAVANLGALAMDNARLYETTKKNYQDMTQDFLTHRFF